MKSIAAFLALAVAASAADMFPFQLPWDDASPSITNVSWLNDKPAGRDGFVSVKDGHLFAGEKRLRIFGVNMCFSANFPTHADADKVAARMAKFGINCVRFHHMDMFSAPAGIFAKDGRALDAEQLDRLDYFIAALKKEGIYADLNLHVSRTYPDRPKAEKKGNPQFDKGVDNYHAPMIALQKDYARDLLSHVNKYTGNAYSAEPAVALVEINNENALGLQWFAGEMDNLPAPYAEDLSAQWTAWLVKKYGAAEKAAWSEGARAAGKELLRGDKMDTGVTSLPSAIVSAEFSWDHQPVFGAGIEAADEPTIKAVKQWEADKRKAQVVKVKTPGSASWHVQISQKTEPLPADTYELSFLVRSDKPAKLSVNLQQSHEPWKVLASAPFEAGPEWKAKTVVFKVKDSEQEPRVVVDGMGLLVGTFEFAAFSLRTAAVDGSVLLDTKGSVPMVKKRDISRATPAKQRDWQEFIWDTETVYWNGMRDFLKKELGVKVPIVGTQGFWSPGHVQSGMDVIDSHAYWHHPQFEGGDWNPEKWTIKNEPMAGAKDGGTLPGLAAQRVAGKPFICTEYNHSAPNTYGAETAPLIAAFAALQDWDGIFLFAYSHNDKWSQEHFDSFFDIARHPVKMATLPGAAVSFRRGDLSSDYGMSETRSVDRESAIDYTLRYGPNFSFKSNLFGMDGKWKVPRARLYVKPVFERQAIAGIVGIEAKGISVSAGGPPVAIWDSGMFVEIVGPKSAVEIVRDDLPGQPDRRWPRLSKVESRQKWACFQTTALDSWHIRTARRILITATADIANTDMGWKNAEKTTVGRDWGKAPVLVEGPAARFYLPTDGKFKAWALDERGQRREEIPVVDGKLEIGPQFKTLWYEVERQ